MHLPLAARVRERLRNELWVLCLPSLWHCQLGGCYLPCGDSVQEGEKELKRVGQLFTVGYISQHC